LIDKKKLRERLPPRVRAREIWRIDEADWREAVDDATLLAVRDQERAGIDIIGDGEMRRESYSNQVANALGGIDGEKHGTAMDRTGRPNPVPLVSGPITRRQPIEVENTAFLKAATERPVKITLPGPFTMTQQAENAYYAEEADLAMAYAEALNQEIAEVFEAGADIVQLDEPYLQARPDQARDYGVAAIDRALAGIDGRTALHICFGYAYVHGNDVVKPDRYAFLSELNGSAVDVISVETAQPRLDMSSLAQLTDKTVMLGVIDMSDAEAETPETVAARIRSGLEHIAAERMIIAPDCGMKYIDRGLAYAKLKSMTEGARIVREELS
jgi:5-methyltetrahydropteroyltriglutamate--homocysteine methyltransferase